MEKIFIHTNGQITRKGKKITSPVLKSLGNMIEIESGFTLASFFSMLEKYPEFTTISDLIEPMIDIAANAGVTGYKTPEIEQLVFYKTIEITGFPGPPSLNIYNTLKGVVNIQNPNSTARNAIDQDSRNQDSKEQDSQNRTKRHKDLKFFHIENLLDHTLILGKLNHIVFGDTEDRLQYETFYTLFEFIEGICWELSFNFNPLQCSIRR